uniref:FYVE-type domain-containing protein n=1 Tax=Peronospora matthiolae TaxID=2874970 RepID=A0AAV1UUE7_9STRA
MDRSASCDHRLPLNLHASPTLSAARNVVELETVTSVLSLESRVVTLTQDEIQVCTRLADLLLADALRAYIETNGSPKVDVQQWKLLKKKDQLGAYKHKRNAGTTGQQLDRPFAAKETELPLLLVTGSVAGHVHDAMYGLVSATTRTMKMNGAYADDSLEDAQVLATIEGPTVKDPFRFLGLKWAVRRDAMYGSSFVKRRDLLYLEATGLTKMMDGQCVGYRVIHSVSIKALAQLATKSISSSVIRARASIVQLFHQQPSVDGSRGLSGTLNVFARGYYDPQGGMMQFMALHAGAELLLHMTFSAVDCAHLKKIAFATQQACRRRQGVASQLHKTYYGDDRGMAGIEEMSDEDAAGFMEDKVLSTHCSLCERRIGSLLNRSGRPCTICARMVCSRCCVVKKLPFFLSDGCSLPTHNGTGLDGSMSVQQQFERPEGSRALTEQSRSSNGSGAANMNGMYQQALKFCLPCVLRANQRNASQIVIEEILEQTSLGLVTPRSTFNQLDGHPSPSPLRRRSTQSVRANNSAQVPYGSYQFPQHAAPIYSQPRQKAYSAPCGQVGVHRSSSITTRVMLYVEDPTSQLPGYKAAA